MDHGGIKSLLERVPEHFQQLSIDWERIRKLSPEAGCKVLARYWVVERTCSWIDQNRRLREDCEKLTESSEAFIYLAMSRLSCRRRASGGRGRSWSGGSCSATSSVGDPLGFVNHLKGYWDRSISPE